MSAAVTSGCSQEKWFGFFDGWGCWDYFSLSPCLSRFHVLSLYSAKLWEIGTIYSRISLNILSLSSRYPTGWITCLNNLQYVPLLKIQRRDFKPFCTFTGIISILFTPDNWKRYIISPYSRRQSFQVQNWCLDDSWISTLCGEEEHKRAVSSLILRMHRSMAPQLDGKTDFFIQVGKIPPRGKDLVLKSPVHFDNLPIGPVRVMEMPRCTGRPLSGPVNRH